MNRVLLLAVVLSAGCELFGGSGSGDGGPSRKNCTQSSDCGAGMLCAGGECKMEGFAGPGARCGTTKECGGGLFCAPTGTCVPAGTATVGDACTSDATCQKGLRCDLRGFGGVCVQGGGAEAGQPCGKSFDCTPGLFCGDGQLCQPFPIAFPPFPGVVCLPDEARFHSFFELPRPGKYPSDFFRMPFPDDARVKKDGMLDLTDFARPGPTPLGIDLVQIYVDAWAKQFAGFGTTTAATFRFSKELDFATATGDAIQLIDLTKGPTFGQPLGRGWGYTTGRNKWSCQHPFTVRSGVESPLLPRHTYGAILLTALASGKGLKGKDGTSPAPDPDLLALLGAMRPAGDEALGSAWDVHAPLREWLTAQKIPSSSVANAALFTVQDATGGMGKLAASVAASPAPVLSDLTLCDAGVKSPCDDGTPARACPAANPDFHEIHGRFTIPIYQAGTAPYLTPQSGGGIVFENGTPKLQRTEGVCFALTVPKKGTQPANGWPLTVY
ncbi:MAG: hypothetical protein EXR72_13430, partial [Myxococcales bacterium]|nr:hypothetical protein [Myxococcales bacterium]